MKHPNTKKEKEKKHTLGWVFLRWFLVCVLGGFYTANLGHNSHFTKYTFNIKYKHL